LVNVVEMLADATAAASLAEFEWDLPASSD
jgi:hypothetical protein